MERQLNIRSNEAVALVERLAKARGTSKADTVLAALKLLEKNDNQPLASSNAALSRFRAIIESIHAQYSNGLPADVDDMYDEFGLPQ